MDVGSTIAGSLGDATGWQVLVGGGQNQANSSIQTYGLRFDPFAGYSWSTAAPAIRMMGKGTLDVFNEAWDHGDAVINHVFTGGTNTNSELRLISQATVAGADTGVVISTGGPAGALERLRVTLNGDVGIGEANPSGRLHVRGPRRAVPGSAGTGCPLIFITFSGGSW